MSLDQLSEQFRTQRVKRRAQSLATITIKRAEPVVGEFRFGGRVLINGQRLGSLLGCEPKTVYVEPGEHKITIIFERRPAILPRLGRTMCSASVSVSAGGRAVFACGIRPEIAQLWVNARRAGALRRTVFVLAVDLAAVPGWLLAPYLRQASVFAVIQLAVNDALIPMCYRLTSPVFCAFWFALLAVLIARRLIFFPANGIDESLSSRIGSPCYLEPMVVIGADAE